ncbi:MULTISPECIES: hypothetical protein [Enterobacterales]|uniref:Uncharacterized protein n=4 Tax=Morganellaceae TaxID=1903414 RepID=A0A899NI09_PROST|nr:MULTISPECIES: hypothetical protein [Enterobacterales]EKH6496411.1 hypothetical protein [Providencia rettgeri]ELB1110354.1 hypothetical protein [Morganella morganii]ELL8907360.1 hypothetical protein [Proteus mirabilis]ELQ1457936.1 hypothetical protein [Providencia rettgeri]ELR5053908.1 hypothetical protein [Providencia rettgeri]
MSYTGKENGKKGQQNEAKNRCSQRVEGIACACVLFTILPLSVNAAPVMAGKKKQKKTLSEDRVLGGYPRLELRFALVASKRDRHRDNQKNFDDKVLCHLDAKVTTENNHHDSNCNSKNKREEAKGIKFHFRAH